MFFFKFIDSHKFYLVYDNFYVLQCCIVEVLGNAFKNFFLLYFPVFDGEGTHPLSPYT